MLLYGIQYNFNFEKVTEGMDLRWPNVDSMCLSPLAITANPQINSKFRNNQQRNGPVFLRNKKLKSKTKGTPRDGRKVTQSKKKSHC